MSCNCYNQYVPCDPQCPNCGGMTTSSTTTTTTLCPDALKCEEFKKDICVIHPGDKCYNIPENKDLQQILYDLLSKFIPDCTTTTTTSTTTTTTIPPTTTTTTCICPPSTTTTSTSTTTTTTLAPCNCQTFSIKNITASTQTYSYENCFHVQNNNVSIAAGATHLICVCDQNFAYDKLKFLVFDLGTGCNTSTTTSTSSTSTTSTSSTTTTTTAAPSCINYAIQALVAGATWSGIDCYGNSIGGSIPISGATIYTGCMWSSSLVYTNAHIKSLVPCPPPTSTTTSTTSTSTTTTTTAAPTTTTSTSTTSTSTTTTTTLNCECYTIYNSSSTFTAPIAYVSCQSGPVSTLLGPLETLNVCVQYGSVPSVPLGMSLTRCNTSCIADVGCGVCTTTSTTHPPTTTTTTLPVSCDDCYEYSVYSEGGGTFQYINCEGSTITMEAPTGTSVDVPCAVEGSVLFIFGFGTATQGTLCGNTCPTTTTTTSSGTTTSTTIPIE